MDRISTTTYLPLPVVLEQLRGQLVMLRPDATTEPEAEAEVLVHLAYFDHQVALVGSGPELHRLGARLMDLAGHLMAMHALQADAAVRALQDSVTAECADGLVAE